MLSSSPHELGRWGEAHAAELLSRQGWTVLARNYRFGRREVDLIARQGDTVVFVEVKTRAGVGFGTPADSITLLKRREIEAVAQEYLVRNDLVDVVVRFDAVAILVDGAGRETRVEHIRDAWRPGWP